ncbi:POT family proton-dependent oligopeptide transporter [Hephaestia caeni]|uniref:POT family proton-dependent oligopeptide transporter n=1 Tax=Hephaestia caeni TaxID=645617 RepID=A0A397PDF9_9SPHN|nr:peptide MFS transporter [Hephaestia caeni]RIA44204.1 POT family proton-dependent oligopeptide transporter [Hephaestia caeni]
MTAASDDRVFFGHPRGLAYLVFTEAWERFSYYGMTSLVVLYMVQQLFLPGHVEHVVGLAAVRGMLGLGPGVADQALASIIFGWYSGLVYFTPIIGGFVADRWLGTRNTVILGAALMSAGHIAMAFDRSFFVALLLLILGSGALKGNISAQVGRLYPAAEESRRTQGYTIFSAGINVGAVAGPLVCGLLAARFGWHIGFGTAGAFMLVAMLTYLAGVRHLPTDRGPATRIVHPPMTAAERRRTRVLIGVIALTVLPNIAYPMIWNVGILWADQHASLATPIGAIPASWFNSIDAFVSIVAVPPLVAYWRWQARRGREPGDIGKIAIGSALAGASAALFALASALYLPGRVPAWFAVLPFAGMGVAFLYFWPTLLALISQAAPPKVNATLMGGAFLSLFVGSVAMGWVGSYYEALGPTAFWLLDAAIGVAGALIILAVHRPLTRALTPGG